MSDGKEASGGTVTAAARVAQTRQLRYRVAFFVTALVAVGLVVTLPFSVKSVVDDVLGSVTGRVIQITPRGSGPPESDHTKLHLAVIAIDEVQLVATIRVAGHHQCPGCTLKNRVLLVALAGDDADANGLPPSAAVTLAPNDVEVSDDGAAPRAWPSDSLSVRPLPPDARGSLPARPSGWDAGDPVGSTGPGPPVSRPGTAAPERHGGAIPPRHPRRALQRRSLRVRRRLRGDLRAAPLPARARRDARAPDRLRSRLLRIPQAAPRSRRQLRSPGARGVGNSQHPHALQSVFHHRRRSGPLDGHHLPARRPDRSRAAVRPRRGRSGPPRAAAAARPRRGNSWPDASATRRLPGGTIGSRGEEVRPS